MFKELSHFLSVYKQLENKKVEIGSIEGSKAAAECVKDCIKAYNETFGTQKQ